jgi:hypothetical protein
MLEAIANVIGRMYYISSSNPDDFFGPHAEGFVMKLLINMNELEKMKVKDMEGQIKTFVSEDRIIVNQKFVRPTEIRNVARMTQSTNNVNGIKIDIKTGARRVEAVETTEKYLGKQYNGAFWTRLQAHFKKGIVISALYDFLNEIDMSKYRINESPKCSKNYADRTVLKKPCSSRNS